MMTARIGADMVALASPAPSSSVMSLPTREVIELVASVTWPSR
jgi:hypothetical protein